MDNFLEDELFGIHKKMKNHFKDPFEGFMDEEDNQLQDFHILKPKRQNSNCNKC